MKIYEFINKLQNLPDNRKKIIIWTVVIILAIILGVFWIKISADRLSTLGEETKDIKLPQVDIPKIDLSGIQTPNDQNTAQKIYTNKEYGFEFQYPSYAKFQIENGGGFIAATFSAQVLSSKDNENIIFPTTIRVYTKKASPDIYNSTMEKDTEYSKIIKTDDFFINIFADKGADVTVLNMVKSTFKFTK